MKTIHLFDMNDEQREKKAKAIYLRKFRLISFFMSLFFILMLTHEAFSWKFRLIVFGILEGFVILLNIYATLKKKQFFTEWP